MQFVKPYQKVFTATILSTLVLALLSPIRPAIIGFMIDKFVMSKENNPGIFNSVEQALFPEGNAFLYWAFVAIGTLLIEAILQFSLVYATNYLGQSIVKDIRNKLFSHILNFKIQYFDKNPIGKLVTRLVSDLEAVAEIFSNGLITMAGDILNLSLVMILMFAVNWKFTLLVLIPIPILLYATRIFKNTIKKAYQSESKQVSRLNTFVQERIIGMSLVQLFTREETEYTKFKEINKEHRNAHIKSVWAYSIFFPVVEILSSISIAFVIFYASYQILDNPLKDVSAGQLFAFILWINMLYRPIRMLADKFNIIQRGMVRSKNIFEILDDNQTIDSTSETNLETNLKGNVSFKNVSFAYNEPDYVLKDVSFEIKAGETVAFVGATGAGKSSIINVLSRFYEFQKGTIEVDGKDIRSFTITSIRQGIAVVLQDVFLFSDSILNNITLRDESITKEQVIEAAKQVGVHDFIMKLPGNYDFNVRERGNTLSTGQRQLISFIRAYVYNPKILVLDEATSSVDTETEELIQSAIEKLTKGRTSIIVAHRLSTIKNADKIIVLDKGKVIEQGTHKQLLDKGGYYNSLYEIQYADK
jgi:ATP-binding cassette subfamily B multidrug efflux pump